MVNKTIIGIFFLSIFFSFNSYSQPLIPELKKSINTYCKTTKDFGNFKQCRGEVYSLLRKQGTDYIFKVDKSYRKDFFITCNRHKKNAFKFNECLFRQVSKFLGEDITLEEPVLVITEKNTDEDEVTTIIEMPPETEINIIERVRSASFLIHAYHNGVGQGLGSAVKINDNQLATACHVILNDKEKISEEILVSNIADEDNFKLAKLVKYDFSKDACILESNEIKNYKSVAKRKFKDLKVFEKIYMVGNPLGFTGRTTRGEIINLLQKTPYELSLEKIGGVKFNPGQLISTNAPADKGNSGGGVYDTKGNLIGITSMCDPQDKPPTNPCIRTNPVNWSIPISSFDSLASFEYSINKEKEDSTEYITKKEEEVSSNEFQNIWFFDDEEENPEIFNINTDWHSMRVWSAKENNICYYYFQSNILLPGNYKNFSYLENKKIKIKASSGEIFSANMGAPYNVDNEWIKNFFGIPIYIVKMNLNEYDRDIFIKNNQISIELMSSDDFNISTITNLLKSKKINWNYQGVDEQFDKLYCK